jgi:hypothetical protein
VSYWHLTPGVIATAVLPVPMVVAAEYLSVDAAQQAIYPEADSFAEVVLQVDAAQCAAIAALAGPQPTHGALHVFRAMHGGVTLGHVLIDEVVGRQDLISYAIGVDASGSMRTLEILAYRESHGGEIRNRAWREQFVHRASLAELRFRTDIKNIAGATLSSEHVTQGVRWLLALWQTSLRGADEHR